MTWMSSTDSDYPWKDSEGNVQTVELNNLKSIRDGWMYGQMHGCMCV